ncbi:hypothetical protein AmaxDRAFT_0552 [Limnospira maxima CS-328]|uniref:Uncharacterized protein n=1 Tax=Limnospira maxima CS-328 TaxID=513049 RepID=B5VVL1_LIMMA|nr:hypothetical protein AmaxDRAFT_0552 [Limnospira maxima CS-328]UWU47959.1 hypothetical protein APLC1_2744 [Arthrospira platensis C1]
MKCNAPLTIQMLMKCQHHSYSPLAVGYALNPPYEEVGCVNEM